MNRETLHAWYQSSRPPFFVATLVPLTLGGVIAHSEGGWDTLRWIVVLLASFLVHLSTNLVNDYFDYVSGADAGDSIGGSRVIQERKITPSQIRNAVIFLYFVAMILGVWIVWTANVWWLAGFAFFAFFSSLFYTAPPIRYGYLGLGEIFVALNMGPIMVVGTVAALSGDFSPRALWLSVPVGLMVATILYYQSLPDIEADRAVGKRTVAVRLGKPAAIWGFRCLVAATMLSIVLLCLSGKLHPAALLSLVTIAAAYRIDRMLKHTVEWKDLHDKGGVVRKLYLANSLILILTVAFLG